MPDQDYTDPGVKRLRGIKEISAPAQDPSVQAQSVSLTDFSQLLKSNFGYVDSKFVAYYRDRIGCAAKPEELEFIKADSLEAAERTCADIEERAGCSKFEKAHFILVNDKPHVRLNGTISEL